MCDICVPFVRHVLMRCGLLRGPLSNVEKDSKFTSSRLSDVSYRNSRRGWQLQPRRRLIGHRYGRRPDCWNF